jgi:hypothetical protein
MGVAMRIIKKRRTVKAATPVCSGSIKINVDRGSCQEEVSSVCLSVCLCKIVDIGGPIQIKKGVGYSLYAFWVNATIFEDFLLSDE